MAEQLIPVATFRQPIEAELAKGKLEAEGVRCFIEDGSLARINWFLSGAVGETKLLVREADRVLSMEILEEDPEQAEAALRTVFEGTDSNGCPLCGSPEIRAEGYPTLTILIALLLVGLFLRVPMLLLLVVLPLLFFRRRRYRCFDCEHRWKKR